jgi:hypothetical protein
MADIRRNQTAMPSASRTSQTLRAHRVITADRNYDM